MTRNTNLALALAVSGLWCSFSAMPVSAKGLEGQLTVYSNVAPQIQQAIDNAFMKANPGVTINLRHLTGSGGEADTVYVTEAMSGGSPADILFGATPVPIQDHPDLYANLREAGVTGLNTWPKDAVSSKYVIAMDGLWGIGYDTQKVTGKNIPNSWKDILNPEFKNDCVMLEMKGKNPGLVTWALTMQKKFGDKFLKGIAAQHCQVTDTGQLAGQVLGAGGAIIGFPFFPSHVNPSKARGAPVAFKLLPDAVVAGSKFISLPANAPHKKLAAAMFSWFLTPQAQKAACGNGTYSSPLPNIKGCVARPAGVKIVRTDWAMTDSMKEKLAKMMGE